MKSNSKEPVYLHAQTAAALTSRMMPTLLWIMSSLFNSSGQVFVTGDGNQEAELCDRSLWEPGYLPALKPTRDRHRHHCHHHWYYKSAFYFTQRHGQYGACSMVETARKEEREGDDSYLFNGTISIYTVSPGQQGRRGRGEKKEWIQPICASCTNCEFWSFF